MHIEITIHGTNSGWWPLPGREHTAWSLLAGNSLYWFDAGSAAASSACAAGLPLLNTRAVFLSHPHFDHVGGLSQLLWMIYRIGALRGYQPADPKYRSYVENATVFGDYRDPQSQMPDIPIYTNTPEIIPLILDFFQYTELQFKMNYSIQTHPIAEGIFFQDDKITVEARQTKHLSCRNGLPQSWAFRIKTPGPTIVFSGDIRYVEDLGDWLEGADLYLLENAHVPPETTYAELKKRNPRFPKLFFLHHGFGPLYEPEDFSSEKKKDMPEAVFAKDGEKISWETI